VADGPTAADESAAADAMAGGVAMAVLYRVYLAAGVPADAMVVAAVCYVPVPGVWSQAWDVRRAAADGSRVADEWRCLHLVWMLVWVPALPRVWRPARAWLAENPADDLVRATREAAQRRDSRRGIRATAGKAAFPSPFFPFQVFGETSKA
jgi:hypothetical protein